MDSIGMAALGGVIGAALGFMIGGLGRRWMMVVATAVAGALLAPILATNLLNAESPARADRDFGAEVDAMFAENEMFLALATVDPDAQQRMRERAIAAFETDGAARAEQVIYEEAFVLGQTALMVYGPRTTDAALLNLQATLLEVSRGLVTEPEHCYALLYSGVAPHNITTQQAMAAGRHPSYARMQDAMVALVLAAGPEVVPHDPDRAALGTGEMQGFVFNNYEESRLRYFSGYQPQTDAEYAQACDAMADLLEYQLNHEYAADMVRAGLSAG